MVCVRGKWTNFILSESNIEMIVGGIDVFFNVKCEIKFLFGVHPF